MVRVSKCIGIDWRAYMKMSYRRAFVLLSLCTALGLGPVRAACAEDSPPPPPPPETAEIWIGGAKVTIDSADIPVDPEPEVEPDSSSDA